MKKWDPYGKMTDREDMELVVKSGPHCLMLVTETGNYVDTV